MEVYEYGAMSSKYSVKADNKFTAYSAMIVHYGAQAGLIAIYSPEECKKDSWLGFDNNALERVDKVFEPVGGFENYLKNNKEAILKSHETIKQLV